MLLAAVASSFALLLASAKAHGRQLRLERELEGYHEVVFGGTNPDWVEARWRQDRVGYWTIVPIAALALVAFSWRAGWGFALLAALLWAPIVGFVALGLASQLRLARALDGSKGDEARRERARWVREARLGSAGWWTLVALLVLATGLATKM